MLFHVNSLSLLYFYFCFPLTFQIIPHNERHMNKQMSLDSLCHHYHATNGSILSLYNYWTLTDRTNSFKSIDKCPNVVETVYKGYLCDDKVDVNPDEMKLHYKFNHIFNASSLLNFLYDNKTIIFAGDSTSYQVFNTLLCMIESDIGTKNYQHFDYTNNLIIYGTAFLNINSTSNDKFNVIGDEDYKKQFLTNFMNDAKNIILNLNKKGKNTVYIVFNSGPHWSPLHLVNNYNSKPLETNEILKAFEHFFDIDGKFMKQLKNLVNDNELKNKNIRVKPIWRDNLPAGSCLYEDKWDYHKLLPKFNKIARESFVKNGLPPGPDIWDAALVRFRNHMSKSDLLHYCDISEYSVYRMVVAELMKSIMNIDNK